MMSNLNKEELTSMQKWTRFFGNFFSPSDTSSQCLTYFRPVQLENSADLA